MKETTVYSAAAVFGAAPSTLFRLGGGNFSEVLAFTRQGRACVLRLTPPDPEINLGSLLSSLAVVDHLARGGVAVPAPLRSLDGSLVVEISSEDGPVLVSAFEKAPGVRGEELSADSWDTARIALLGGAVGRMHARGASYRPASPELARPAWDQVGNCFHPREEAQGELLRLRRAEALAAVQALPRSPDAYGLIHTDLHGGNFLFDLESQRITLLDFDDCAQGWYGMDIAMSLHDFCVLSAESDKDSCAARFLRAYLAGYLPEHFLAPAWLERLPLFLKLLETGLYCQVAPFAAEADPDSWTGRFMAGRQERIESAAPVFHIDYAGIARESVSHVQR